jgi:hypothetical protein
MNPAAEWTPTASNGPPIIQYWHTAQPPERINCGLMSFAECNPDLRHLIFDEPRADAFIAAHFSNRELAAFQACGVPAMQADYFRYCAVFALGGLYADADLRCIADVRPLVRYVEGTLFGREDIPERAAAALRYPYPVGPVRDIDNSPFAFGKPGHPLLELAIEVATANIESRVADGPQGIWLTAGQGVFTSMYLLNRLGSIDSFLAYAKGTGLEPSATLFCDVVGSHSAVATAMAEVAVRPRQERSTWVRSLPQPEPGERLPHWAAIKGSIFR